MGFSFFTIFFFIFLFLHVRLRIRIERLERLIQNKHSQAPVEIGTHDKPVNAVPAMTMSEVPAPPAPQKELLSAKADSLIQELVHWVKEDWAMKLGALLILVAIGWFVSYAFANDWVGPTARIALGVLLGVFILILGYWRIRNFIYQGSIFTLLGGTTILLTLFAAEELYDMFIPAVVLIMMFLTAAFVACFSVQFKVRWLSVAGIIMAGIAPILANVPQTNDAFLLSYLLALVAGTILVVSLSGFRELTGVALLIVWFYSIFLYFAPDASFLIYFAYVFTALFFFTNSVGILKGKGTDIIPDLVIAAANGLFLLSWVLLAANVSWQSTILLISSVAFLVGGFFLYQNTKRDEVLYSYVGVAFALLVAATAREFHGAVFTIALAIESSFLPVLAYFITKEFDVAKKSAYLLVVPAIFVSMDLFQYSLQSSIFDKHFFSVLIFIFLLVWLGAFFRELRVRAQTQENEIEGGCFAVGSVFSYFLLWLVLQNIFMNDDYAVLISLAVYTIIGIFTYFWGLLKESATLRLYGGILIIFVIARLFLVDVWKMEVSLRIVTFLIVGILFISTAYYTRRKIHSG